MARGQPLTPAQVATIVEVYERTGNKSEAARAAGVVESAARRALSRRVEATRSELHARAAKIGVRRGRRAINDNLARIVKVLATCDDGLSGGMLTAMEPRDLADLSKALTATVKTLLEIDTHRERGLQARLVREKLRAEISALKAKPEADTGEVTVVVRVAGD